MTLPKLVLPTTLTTLALLAGCSTLPPENAQLEAARRDYRTAQADPTTRDRAAVELGAANDALRRADESWTRKDSVTEVDHWAYLTRQQVAIARETGLRRASEQASKDALAGRDQVRLSARTAEADAAQRQTVASEQAAEAARQQAQTAQRQTLNTQARNDELEAQMRDMNARKTERGMVVTIGDVLFETDASTLRTDGLRSVDKLVDFMKRYPQRSALIEGFTDSTGSASYNQLLSNRRADTVQTAIVERGIDRSRLGTHGYGEAYPVAGNDSSSGRQMNRRVEIILSDESGAAVMPR
jgi:outer membrane protein OmpA-like peptidoglycan-associated protein